MEQLFTQIGVPGSKRAEHYCDTLLALTRFHFISTQPSANKLEERQSFIWNIFLNQIELQKECNDEHVNTLQVNWQQIGQHSKNIDLVTIP